MRTDLTDTTIMIPVRIDSVIRLENLILIVKFLHRYFNCRIVVLEADSYNNGLIKRMLGKRVQYYFIEDCDNVFYRTKYHNEIAKKVTTPYICIWDIDIIIPPNQILEAMNKLRNEKYDIALPYDGRALDTPAIIREMFVKNSSITLLNRQQNKMNLLYKTIHLRGGAFFANTEAYKKAGMENTAFYGWGSEDFDRFDKWKILGYNIYLAKGVLFHLTHPRGDNSKFKHTSQYINSEESLFTTRVSSPKEIYDRIKLLELE